MKLLEELKKEIKPDRVLMEHVIEVVDRINTNLKKNNIKAKCVLGGSFAKGTFLKNDYDVDLFIRFDYKYKNKNISDMLEKVLCDFENLERVHGSRDYFQLKEDIIYELVPVLDIDNYTKAENVTDMSPLHVYYVKKYVDKNPELADEIRLAKKFCKGIEVYGAESYLKGFSGHVLDILIIHYGSFEKLLMQASVWGKKVVIDVEKHLKDPIKELNKSKTHSPLILVDPIQPDRNAAAALGREKFDIFKQKARDFLHKSSKEFFTIKKISNAEVQKRNSNEWLIFLEVSPLEGKKDVVGAKIMKAFEHICKYLKINDFKIIESKWQFGYPSHLYFVLKKEKMSDFVIRKGPPEKTGADFEKFMEKHGKKAFIEKGWAFAKLKRQYKIPTALVKDLISSEYIKEKTEKIKLC